MNVVIFDIFGIIVGAILGFLLIGLAIAVVAAVAIYLAFRSLPMKSRQAIILLMFVTGFILMITLLGIEIGFVVTMVGVFLSILNAFGGGHDLMPQG